MNKNNKILRFIFTVVFSFIITSSINIECKEKPDSITLEKMEKQKYEAKKEAIEYYKKYPKLEKGLAELVDLAENNKIKEMENYAKIHNIDLENNSIKVIISYNKGSFVDKKYLIDLGATNIHGKEKIQTKIPIKSLKTIVDDKNDICFIDFPQKPASTSILSEGYTKIKADFKRLNGYSGSGVKIAIIDKGFKNISNSIISGDFKSNPIYFEPEHPIRTLTDESNDASSLDHGTNVAEIVYDIAPSAAYYIIKVADLQYLDDAVQYCITNNVDIINYSNIYFNRNFYDGEWYYNDDPGHSVEIAEAANILWVNSAGNYANRHYYGTFNNSNSSGNHYFSTNDDSLIINAKVNDNIKLYLTWNNWPSTNKDYDIYLYDPTNTLVASGNDIQNGTYGHDSPAEKIDYIATMEGDYTLKVSKWNTYTNLEFHLFSEIHDIESQYQVHAKSIPNPPDSEYCISVGAVNQLSWTNGPQESYSSQGPTSDSRHKPDIVAPTNVLTYARSLQTNKYFGGTSAAAPYVTGAAALILQQMREINSSASGVETKYYLKCMASHDGLKDDGNNDWTVDSDIFGAGKLNLDPIYKNFEWLSTKQNPSGYWSYGEDTTLQESVGLTGMVLTAYLNDPDNNPFATTPSKFANGDNSVISKGLGYLQSKQVAQSVTTDEWERGAIVTNRGFTGEGSHRSGLHVYETSTALWAFLTAKTYGVETVNSVSIDDIIKNAADFLVRAQCAHNHNSTGDDYPPTGVDYTDANYNYGGWGYPVSSGFDEADTRTGQEGWADMSNTQFALLALRYADKAGVGFAWDQATSKVPIKDYFLTRCRNIRTDLPYGDPAPVPDNPGFEDTLDNNPADSGYIYRPFNMWNYWGWGMGKSYASITAAGIWSAWCLGVNTSDSKYTTLVGTPKTWFENNWYTNCNKYVDPTFYGGEQMWYYYYLMTAARAFSLYSWTTIDGHDWYKEFSNQLLYGTQDGTTKRREADGNWKGKTDFTWDGEAEGENDVLATLEAILTLETNLKKIVAGNPVTITWKMSSQYGSPDIHLYDSQGRHVGMNYNTNEMELQIPNAYYSGPNSHPEIITLIAPGIDDYSIGVYGVMGSAESYDLGVESYNNNILIDSATIHDTIYPSELKTVLSPVKKVLGPANVSLSLPEIQTTNRAPVISGIYFTPDIPNYTNTLTCNVTASDPDVLDTLHFNYKWYLGNQVIKETNTSSNYDTLASTNITKGDVWKCQVTVYDNSDLEGNIVSKEISIHAIAPTTITNLSANEGTIATGIRLLWTTPIVDGAIDNYFIQYSTNNNPNWNYISAQIITAPTFVDPQTCSITGLSTGSTYYFRIWTTDTERNWSDISNGATLYLKPPVEYICTIKQTGGDYNSLYAWQNAVHGDLANSMGTRVFAYEGLIGTISDSATVTGQTSSATGIAIHVTTTQVLIKNISGKFQSGETITAPSGSLTLLDSGSPAIAVAKIDGTWTSTDTSRVDLDGWTTSETNYIKIYTTPEARHNGTWSNDKYRLSVNSQYRGGLNLYAANVKIDGLQIENSADAHDHLAMGIREFYAPSAPQTCTREISNCIIRYSGTTTPDNSTTNSAILLDSSSNTISTCKIWNNMLYGFGNGIRVGYCTTGSTYYLYNNTIVNCDAAGDSVRVYGQWAPDKIYLYMKNNLVQGTTTNYRISLYPTALYEHSSNISSDNSSPDGDSYRNKPVTFLDPSNHDYHIADYDTSVKNKGVDLSLDPNLPFTADIDGQTRPFGATWDVGADEGYYIPTEYVCTIKETGSDFKTLSSWNEAIKCDLVHSTGTRVFSHGGITGTIPNGATVTGESSGATGKATHATSAQVLIKNISGRFTKNEKVYYQDTNSNYIILSDYGSPAIAIAKIDGTWNVADSTATISGWQTSPNNYVKIYTTPEARHPGKWDETKYRLSAQKNYTCVMAISVPHVYVDGLQIENTGGNPSANREMLRDYYTNAPLSGEFEGQTFYREISNNYIRYAGSTTANRVTGMEFNTSFATGTYKAWNNIIEGCGTGIQASYCTSGSTYCIYNNTVKAKEEWCYGMYFNAKWSYTQKYMFLYLKNNLIQGSTNCYYVGSINGLYKETWNNISGDSTSPDNDYRNKPVYFMDISNGDYHLSEADTLAIGTGLNLTSDSWLGFNTDIDGGLRPATGAWDIGADQYNSARGMMKVGRNRAGPDPTFRLGDVFSFPNPAKGGINPTIHAEVGIADSVELKIYNIAAELVHSANISDTLQIINNKYAYEYTWQANGVASGVYIYYIDARKQGEKNIRVVKKLAVIR